MPPRSMPIVSSQPPMSTKPASPPSSGVTAGRGVHSGAASLNLDNYSARGASRRSAPNTSAANLTRSSLPNWPYGKAVVATQLGFALNKDGFSDWSDWIKGCAVAPHFQRLQELFKPDPVLGPEPGTLYRQITQSVSKNEKYVEIYSKALLKLTSSSWLDERYHWLRSGALSEPEATSRGRRCPKAKCWLIAATMYRIYEGNKQNGSPAAIANKRGSPRWYALWALIRYLWRQQSIVNSDNKQRQAPGVRETPQSDGRGNLPQTHPATQVTSQRGSSSSKIAGLLVSSTAAAKRLETGPTSVKNTSGVSIVRATRTETDAICSSNADSHSPDLSSDLAPRESLTLHTRGSEPKSSLPTAADSTVSTLINISESSPVVTEFPQNASFLRVENVQSFSNIDALDSLQDEVASRVKKDEEVQKWAQGQLIRGCSLINEANGKAQMLRTQLRLADEEVKNF
jgi:hypothetical protein